MIKVAIRKHVSYNMADSSWKAARRAMDTFPAKKETHAYRESKAATVSVSYVSRRSIIRESGDTRIVIGEVASRVKIVEPE